jgi:hypothetical protein
MGLPEIIISFQSKGLSAIKRSARGVVALILKDNTKTAGEIIYKSIDEVVKADWTATNYDYISKVFMGTPSKIIIERIATTATDYNSALSILKNKKFNYLAIPAITQADVTNIATWVKSCRTNDKKTFKAVLPNVASDDEGIINYCTEDNNDGTKVYSASEYTSRIAGILAGLSLSRSSTYYVLEELISIKESVTPNEDIDAGKLILINDGENIKIARGVNSLTTTTADKGEDFKKIKIIEGMDLVRDDIKDSFESSYIGDIINIYDNKQLFLASVNAYFKTLEKTNILDPSMINYAEINYSAQYNYLKGKGVDVDVLAEQQVKEYNTGAKVFMLAHAKFVDAMEDLYFDVYI